MKAVADEVIVWILGGTAKTVGLSTALDIASTLLYEETYLWERRIPGVDCEVTWQQDCAYVTLLGATKAAFPNYRDFGLTTVQAAVICMNMGLVLSTGVIKGDCAEEG